MECNEKEEVIQEDKKIKVSKFNKNLFEKHEEKYNQSCIQFDRSMLCQTLIQSERYPRVF